MMPKILVSLFIAALFGLTAGGVFAQDAAPAEPTGEPLSSEEVQELFTGNTEIAVAMKQGIETGRQYKAHYRDDGTYMIQERKGFKHGGSWFVDPLGRHCFRPGKKDKTKCDVIVREGEHFIRLRDGGRRGKFSIEKGNPHGI